MKHDPSKFFNNRECPYFPCHKGLPDEDFNCLFCYCPLYPLGEKCGGNFSYTAAGIKDCSHCIKPHIPEFYDEIVLRFDEIVKAIAKISRMKND